MSALFTEIASVFLALAEILSVFFGISTGDRIVTGKTVFSVELRTDVSLPPDDVWDNGAQYPTIIELSHNRANNGTLLCTSQELMSKDTSL